MAEPETYKGGYVLDNNTPNPFNPVTTIKFSLGDESHVILRVFNVLGQSISTLVDGELPAGEHRVKWNSKDDFGNDVPGGLYLCHLYARSQRNNGPGVDFQKSIKLLLVR